MGWCYPVDKGGPWCESVVKTVYVISLFGSTESVVEVEAVIGNKSNGSVSHKSPPFQFVTLVEEESIGLGAISDQNALECVGLDMDGWESALNINVATEFSKRSTTVLNSLA